MQIEWLKVAMIIGLFGVPLVSVWLYPRVRGLPETHGQRWAGVAGAILLAVFTLAGVLS